MTKIIERNTDDPGPADRDLQYRPRTTSPRWTSWCCKGSGNAQPDNRVLGGSGWRASGRRRAECRRSRSPSTSTRTDPERLRPGQGHRREQRITISESSNLDQAEVERMIADAERHRDEDARLRELVDARNASTPAA
jgi:molecular chaperone DnaK